VRDADVAEHRAGAGDADGRLHRLAGADALERRVDADAAGHVLDLLDRLLPALGDDVGRAKLGGQPLAIGMTRHRDDPLRAEAPGSENAAHADGAVADHGDGLAGLDLRADRGVMSGGHHVRERHQRLHHLVGVTRARHGHERGAGQRHADCLALSAVAVAREHPAVQAGGRDAVLTVGAGAVAEHVRRDDEVTLGDSGHLAVHVFDHANELVADRAGLERRVAAVEPEVRAADAREDHADDGVGGLDDRRITSLASGDGTGLVEDGCTHARHLSAYPGKLEGPAKVGAIQAAARPLCCMELRTHGVRSRATRRRSWRSSCTRFPARTASSTARSRRRQAKMLVRVTD